MASLENDVEALENAIRLFVQTLKRPQHWAKVTASTGINLDRPSAVILHILIAREPRRFGVQDVAKELGIEPPSVTRKTQLLEDLGYLKRLPDATDKRAVSLEVTAKGRKVNKKLWDAQRKNIMSVLDKWSDEDRHQLVIMLERFSHDLNEAI